MTNHFQHASIITLAAFAWAGLAGENGRAATLQPETVAAWDAYVQSATAKNEARLQPGGQFLWTLENADRAAKVRAGEIVVAPASSQTPRKVPGGMIHHWIGAAFLPNLKIDEVLAITRDYDHYKNYFSPSVVDSKTVSLNGPADRFSMLLMNKAFFLKTALDADYEATVVRLDDCRAYAVSKTTRVQEIEDYGRAGEHRIREGAGSGVIWKLYSVSRLSERDGGVYVELEGIALSREIPAALRFMVDPVVRRVSRNSLLVSLQQTEDAVRGHAELAARHGNSPSVHLGSMASGFVAKSAQNGDHR